MALIHKKHVTERETVSYKLDRKTIELVRCYSEFIGSPQEHVVNEALRFIFKKDRDFAGWLALHKKGLDAGDDTDPSAATRLKPADRKAKERG